MIVKDEPLEVADYVARHLVKQGKPSFVPHEGCKYRVKDGDSVLMCAGGALIPDSEYRTDLEGKSAINMDFFKRHHPASLRVIQSLQIVHDAAADMHRSGYTWTEALLETAELHEIDCSDNHVEEGHDEPYEPYVSSNSAKIALEAIRKAVREASEDNNE